MNENEFIQLREFDKHLNEICPFTFEYKPSKEPARRQALIKIVEAYNIEYSWHGQSEITILNQKIKNHEFIEKLFNLEL
jgi:hypothetical protein